MFGSSRKEAKVLRGNVGSKKPQGNRKKKKKRVHGFSALARQTGGGCVSAWGKRGKKRAGVQGKKQEWASELGKITRLGRLLGDSAL